MINKGRLIAIYDFELFPYALGDVLTWNIRTAMRCEELGKEFVDVYVCLDERCPASVYQRDVVNSDNYEIFFSELYGAFGTNPRLGNLLIFRQKKAMLEHLRQVVGYDPDNQKSFNEYHKVIKIGLIERFRDLVMAFVLKPQVKTVIKRIVPTKIKKFLNDIFAERIAFFLNNVCSHATINKFYTEHKYLPNLKPSLGCLPDVEELIARMFKGKILIPFHLRLRRLDLGYGGDQSYSRDSNFLEWYNFLREAAEKYPQVQFIALGRLQEKPLEIMRLPNVTSLRLYGMGLGHELTLMLKSHLFIGSSSGFAALANFSSIPYFITRMNQGSCKAYDIPYGTEKLPFANENQRLIYDEENSKLLMRLLEEGLNKIDLPVAVRESARSTALDVTAWFKDQSKRQHAASTTCRFYHDGQARLEETVYLLLPYLEEARKAFIEHKIGVTQNILQMLEQNFPDLCDHIPQYVLLKACVAVNVNDDSLLQANIIKLQASEVPESLKNTVSHLLSILTGLDSRVSFMEKLRHGMKNLNFAVVA